MRVEEMNPPGASLSAAERTATQSSAATDARMEQIQAAIRGLTKVQRMYVIDGCIHGDCTMTTVRALDRKGLFHLVISSPNGRAGFMRMTPLGEAVRRALKEAQ